MRKTKICITGPSLNAVSGVATHLNQLLGSELVLDFTFQHFQVGSEGRHETSLRRAARLFTTTAAFFFFLVSRRPRIVHLNSSINTKSFWRDTGYLLIAKFLRRRIVFQVHGGDLPDEFYPNSVFLQLVIRSLLRLPDKVVVLSSEEFRAYRMFLPEGRVAVVPNAISTRPPKVDIHKPERGMHVVFVGRIIRSKGIFEVVYALSEVLKTGRQVTLSIAGSGPDEPAIRDLVETLQLGRCVGFHGELFGDEKARLWDSAHVFAFPTYAEGLPYALLEAMEAGAVPISCRIGGIVDVIEEGIHGLFIERQDASALADAIVTLDKDRTWLARMSEAGRAKVFSFYNIPRLASDFRVIYESVA